eukprot:726705-Amphidinium_carterae.1
MLKIGNITVEAATYVAEHDHTGMDFAEPHQTNSYHHSSRSGLEEATIFRPAHPRSKHPVTSKFVPDKSTGKQRLGAF